MAVLKAKRSNPLAQPQPRNARRRRNSQINDPQLKSQQFEILKHLNRGYGIALANLDRLEHLTATAPSWEFSHASACATCATGQKSSAPWPTTNSSRS
jgi:hypothetical protein